MSIAFPPEISHFSLDPFTHLTSSLPISSPYLFTNGHHLMISFTICMYTQCNYIIISIFYHDVCMFFVCIHTCEYSLLSQKNLISYFVPPVSIIKCSEMHCTSVQFICLQAFLHCTVYLKCTSVLLYC